MSLVDVAPYISIAKDVITAGAAVFAAHVAVKGLSTWQRQFHGQQDYILAKQIALAAVKYHSALDEVRNPFMWFDIKEMPSKAHEQLRVRFNEKAGEYKKRWDAVIVERDILDAAIVEAKVVWKDGAELAELGVVLFDLEKELRRSVLNYLQSTDPEGQSGVKAAAGEALHKARDILHDLLEDKPDSFEREVSAAVQRIVIWLGPKMSR